MNNPETLTTLGTQDTLDVDKQNITQKTIKHDPKKNKTCGEAVPISYKTTAILLI